MFAKILETAGVIQVFNIAAARMPGHSAVDLMMPYSNLMQWLLETGNPARM
jgi:hypothetical protein